MLALWFSSWPSYSSQREWFPFWQNQPHCRGTTGFCPESHYFSWYTVFQWLTKTSPQTKLNKTGLLVKMYNLQQNFCVRTHENWQSGVANGEWNSALKNQGHHILQVLSRQKFRTPSKTVWWETQNLPSSKISKNHFQLQIHLPKTLWGNPGVLQHQVSLNQAFSQQKMGTQPVHHITNL